MKAKTTVPGTDLSTLHLSPETFETVYHTIAGLRFPMDVAQVLELRYLINHGLDSFPEPAATPDYREFQDALQGVIDSIGIENKRHSERLLRILAMMRELHYHYSIKSRDAETALRSDMANNRRQRTQSLRYGLLFVSGAILAGLFWLGLPEPGWPVKLLTAGLAILSWLYFRSLPDLDRELKSLETSLNDLRRHRVKSIHWRQLVQKLALVLGYKHDSDVEVFRIDSEFDLPGRSRVHH